jgi:hypothetical protein
VSNACAVPVADEALLAPASAPFEPQPLMITVVAAHSNAVAARWAM